MALELTKPAGTWTYNDLLSLPDDGRRYEIVEGDLYEMPAPTWEHAITVMNVIALLLPVVSAMGGQVVTAPLDTFFQGADPVQPDVLVILPGSRAVGGGRGVEGPPDLLIEVLSPSNRGHDVLTKRTLYARAGVREYWIVDPMERVVELLTLDRDAFHVLDTGRVVSDLVSPVLGGAIFTTAQIFARLDEITGEQTDQ